MSNYTDPRYLRNQQYRDDSNLDARAALHRRYSTSKQDWHRWVFDRLALPAQAAVLELGCGPGWLWQANLDRIPAGWRVTLSDFSPGMVQTAQRNLADGGRPFAFRVIDAQRIPFPDESLDTVIANHMLYHVPDLPRALAEIVRVLRPGGALYAATNGPAHMRELDDLIVAFAPELEPLVHRDKRHSFRLNNGAELLAPYFAQVQLHRYEDGLEVPEAEPLAAYVFSMIPLVGNAALAPAREAFTQFVAEQIKASGGVLRISKESGLFVAMKSL
ncbi:MAG: hypothetical protein Kow0077_19110 [Anaerolineae bacterium]